MDVGEFTYTSQSVEYAHATLWPWKPSRTSSATFASAFEVKAYTHRTPRLVSSRYSHSQIW